MKYLLILSFITAAILACGRGSESRGSDQATGASDGAGSAAPAADRAPGAFPAHLRPDWRTDFEKRAISPDELQQGQIKDGIPAISEPQFVSVTQTTFLKDAEPVIAFEWNGEARAYPLQILIWHEIVNDVVGGQPVLITFCPLCNTAIAFDRVVDGVALEFGVSGFLRNSDLVMFDRETESWWQQITGDGLVGHFTGTRLELLPSTIVSWQDFRESFPDGRVLSRNTGYARPYGENPYVGYDDIESSPFLFRGNADGRLQPMERVVTVEANGETAAFPFSQLEKILLVQDSVGGQDVVIFFKPGTVSALDKRSIVDSRDIGAAAVFVPVAQGQPLTFVASARGFSDRETNSTWDIFGKAIDGPLKGQSLEPVVSGNHFWFAWAAFKPETRIWRP